MKCTLTIGPFSARLCHLARRMAAYEISFSFLPAYNKCTGELWLASGRHEMYEGDTFEEVAEAMYARLLGIRRRQIRAGLTDEEETFYDQ